MNTNKLETSVDSVVLDPLKIENSKNVLETASVENIQKIKIKKKEINPINPYLTNATRLILHTKTAKTLFEGDWRAGKMGLIQFARMVSQLLKAAREDDPYAEWILHKVYQAMRQKKEELKLLEIELQEKTNALRGFDVLLFANEKPIKVSLPFSSSFGFMAAFLIENVDYLTRVFFTLRRLELSLELPIDLKPAKLLVDIQAIFDMTRKWKKTDITRQDIINQTPKAMAANKRWGKVPLVILNKEIQASYLPR